MCQYTVKGGLKYNSRYWLRKVNEATKIIKYSRDPGRQSQ